MRRPDASVPRLPSQNASIWSMARPAEASASCEASSARSPTPLSQCSPNWVQPMPTIATRSRIPLLDMSCLLALRFYGRGRYAWRARARRLSAQRSRLPEVVVDAVGGVQTAERHLDAVADLDRLRIDVGELTREAAALIEVEHRHHHRRLQRVSEAIRGVGRDRRLAGGERLRLHLIDGVAHDADARRRQVGGAAALAARADEAVLPALGAIRRRRGGTLGIGPARL